MSIKKNARTRTREKADQRARETAKLNNQLFRKNRLAYKSKLWQVILYVAKDGKDADIAAKLLSQDSINAYLKLLIRADIKASRKAKKAR